MRCSICGGAKLYSFIRDDQWCFCPDTLRDRFTVFFMMNDPKFAQQLKEDLAKKGIPSGDTRVRGLTDEEKVRFRECLEWIQGQEGLEDSTVYQKRLQEARERWPDVARAIGF